LKHFNLTIYIPENNKSVDVDETTFSTYLQEYPYGYFIGDNSKKWIMENSSGYILVSGEIKHNGMIYENAVMFKDKSTAATFKLVWL